MSTKVLFGFHAVTVRLKTAPQSIAEIHIDVSRRDARMRQFVDRARDAGVRIVDSDDGRLTGLAGGPRHQGVVAKVTPLALQHSVDAVLEAVEAEGRGPALVLVLDGVTDPHNLGAYRTEDHALQHLLPNLSPPPAPDTPRQGFAW